MISETAENVYITPDLDEIIRKMDDYIARFSREGDPRERFLLMYRTFKDQLRRNIRAGRFLDANWAEAICCRMAETYFEAEEHYRLEDGQCPECWDRAFSASLRGETNVLQDALLGMNAHINYDLTISTYDTLLRFDDLRETGGTPGIDRTLNRRLRQRYYDYLLINQIAWESIPQIQDVLTERFSWILGVLNRLSFRRSRLFMERVIMDYRDRAWGHVLLMGSVRGENEMENLLQFMDLQAVRNIRRVMTALSWNPLTVVRGMLEGFPPGEVDLDEKEYSSVSNLLLSKLERYSTATYAHRALVEYGKSAEDAVISALEDGDVSTRTRSHLIRILGEIGSGRSITTIIEQLKSPDKNLRDLVCAELAGVNPELIDTTLVEPHIRSEIDDCIYAQKLLMDLARFDQTGILKDTFSSRYKRGLRRIIALLAFRVSAPEEMPDHSKYVGSIDLNDLQLSSRIRRKLQYTASRLLSDVESLFSNEGDPFGSDQPELSSGDSVHFRKHLERFLTGEDSWLILCAGYIVLTGQMSDLADELRTTILEQPGIRSELGLSDCPLENISSDTLLNIWSEDSCVMMSTIEKILYLKNVALFNEIPAEELTQIARLAKEKAYEKGDFIIREGEEGSELIILLEGRVSVRKMEKEITELGRNAVIGEMSLLADKPTTADCVAAEQVKALIIQRSDFRRMLYGNHPEIALGLLRVLTERLEETTNKAES